MPSLRSAPRYGALTALVVCLTTVGGLASDVARFMPCETAVYLGWSPAAGQLPAQQELALDYLKGLRDLATKNEADKSAPWLPPVLDLLPFLQTASVGVGLFDVTLAEGSPDIEAALVIDAGADTTRLAEIWHQVVSKLGGAVQVEEHKVKDVLLVRVPISGTPMYLVSGLHKGVFLAALGDRAAGKVIDCLNGNAAVLADAEEFVFVRKKVQARTDGGQGCFYVDVQRVVQRAMALVRQTAGELPPQVEPALQELGISAVRSKFVYVENQGPRSGMAAFAHVTGPLKGLLKLWDQKPLADEDLKIVPKDAYWAEVVNLDLAGLWQEVLRIVEALAPDQMPAVEGGLAMLKPMLGFSLTEDLLPAFGDTWAFFDAPDHGGLLLTGTVLVAEVKDAEALQGILTRAVQVLSPLARLKDINLTLKRTQHGGREIHYLLIAGAPSPVAPAWAFVHNRWVLGLWPQTVAAALKQVDPKTGGESLLDHPDFQATRGTLPKDIQSVGYLDSRYLLRLMYPIGNAMLTAGASMLGKEGLDIDLRVLPPVGEAVGGVSNYVGASAVDQDGILYVGRGDGTPLVAGGTALTASIMLPSLARAREIAKRAVSASNLRGIGQACFIYANDHGDQFPPSLEVLLEKRLIVSQQLASPRDEERRAISYAYVAGQKFTDDPRNVLAYERLIGGEGTNVLFVDGHVEWMKVDNFKAALRRTYERLGRQDAIPPEFRE